MAMPDKPGKSSRWKWQRVAPLVAVVLTLGAIGIFCFSARLPAQAPPPTQAPDTAPATPPPYTARKICELSDQRIDESSGLAASRLYPGAFWTHNDSGDSARAFLINSTGQTLSEIVVQGAQALDWEDMSVAGTAENAWVYIGDIGDNAEKRANIPIYRFREPRFDIKNPPAQQTVVCETMTLTYPDKPHNAETLIAAPNGQLLIVTKSLDETFVYQTPKPFTAGSTQQLENLGELTMPEGFRQSLTTAGDLSPDGEKLVVMTYAQAHEWQLKGWTKDDAPGWKDIIKTKPRIWDLPKSKQMEAVCYGLDSQKIYSTSEQLPTPIFEYTPASQ